MNLSDELKWRGFVNQTTFKDITELDGDPIKFYWGVDPSADSMTIGNLAAGMMARVFIKHGHIPVLLVGGATGMIGDPDGKAQERDLLSLEQLQHNVNGIVDQYKSIFSGFEFEIVNNYDWFKDMNYLEFLRDVGKHVPMRVMLSREFVQSRLGEDGAGISYAEFSYSLIQGYDFLHLNRHHDVTLQLCGADQWGNSIAGVDLIRRIEGKEAHIWSTPLIINKATGVKFGKSEDGAVWLDSNKTSVYKFYQFWINLDDDGIEHYMKIYTDLNKDEIESVIAEHEQEKSQRIAQKRLAWEVTKLIHGEDRANSVQNISEVLFGGKSYSELSGNDFKELESELPTCEMSLQEDFLEALVGLGLASSKGEARRFAQNGAIYVNGEQLSADNIALSESNFIDGYLIVRRGKNTNALIKLA